MSTIVIDHLARVKGTGSSLVELEGDARRPTWLRRCSKRAPARGPGCA